MKNGKEENKNTSIFAVPLEKRSIVRLVINRIKEAIINKEIKPGDYLPSESDLAQNLGVGKSSVREALKMLEAMGVVEIKQGAGTFIPKKPAYNSISPLLFQLLLEQASSENLIELRMIFEPAYTELAMKNAEEEDFKMLEECICTMENKIKNGEQTVDDDLRFHELILLTTRNPLIVHIGKTINELFIQSVSSSMKTIPETALNDHKQILTALKSKDKEKLYNAMLNSYKGWITNI